MPAGASANSDKSLRHTSWHLCHLVLGGAPGLFGSQKRRSVAHRSTNAVGRTRARSLVPSRDVGQRGAFGGDPWVGSRVEETNDKEVAG